MSVGGVVETRRLLGLQYLRAAAALAVLLFHALRADEAPWRALSMGIDVFFVLSGFLMVAITDAHTRPLSFIKARITRIGPLYWTLTLVAFAIAGAHMAWRSPASFPNILSYPSVQLLHSLAFVPAWTADGIFPVIPGGWTLNLEIFFYAIFAVVLMAPRRMQLPLLSALFLNLVAAGHFWPSRYAWAITWTNPMILEFLAGAWMGWAWQRGARLLPTVALILIAWIPCALIFAKDPPIAPLDPGRLLDIPAVVALLAGVLALERRPGGIRDWAPARILGDASYSIYLWQFIPILILGRLERRLGLADWQYGAGVFALGVGGGLAVHYLLELRLARSRAVWCGAPTNPR